MEFILLLIVGAIVYAVVRATIQTNKVEDDFRQMRQENIKRSKAALEGEESIYDENRNLRQRDLADARRSKELTTITTTAPNNSIQVLCDLTLNSPKPEALRLMTESCPSMTALEQARLRVSITVANAITFLWLFEPLIGPRFPHDYVAAMLSELGKQDLEVPFEDYVMLEEEKIAFLSEHSERYRTRLVSNDRRLIHSSDLFFGLMTIRRNAYHAALDADLEDAGRGGLVLPFSKVSDLIVRGYLGKDPSGYSHGAILRTMIGTYLVAILATVKEESKGLQATREALKALGCLLTNWCFDVSSDAIVNQISGNGKFVSEALIPRLRFSLLIANSFLVIIAANDALKEHARWTIDAFQHAFLEAVKEKYKTPAIIGDVICSKVEMAELTAVMRPPDGVNLASTTINLSDLIGIVQEIRMNPAITLYRRGSVADGFGKMGPFAHLFVRQLLGDDAVADTGQVPDQVLVQWFSSVFQTTLKAALDLLARGLPKTIGSIRQNS